MPMSRSTHMLLPRGAEPGLSTNGAAKRPVGCLLHAKFLDTFAVKAEEEMARGEHYANSHEYRAYREGAARPARSVVQVEREIHQLAPAGDSGPDVEGELGMTQYWALSCCATPRWTAPRRWRGTGPTHGCPVVIHVDKRTPQRRSTTSCAPLWPIWPTSASRRAIACEWGTWGIVAATQAAGSRHAARLSRGAACLPRLRLLPAAAPGARSCRPIWTNARAPISSKASPPRMSAGRSAG